MRRATVLVGLALLVLVPLGASQDEAPAQRRVQIELKDEGCPAGAGRFCVEPSQIQAHEEETLVLEIENRGRVRHNLTPAGGMPSILDEEISVAPLPPNGTASVTLTWETLSAAREELGRTNLTLECGFDGHPALGERLVITVGEPETPRPQPGLGLVGSLGAIGLALVVLARTGRDR